MLTELRRSIQFNTSPNLKVILQHSGRIAWLRFVKVVFTKKILVKSIAYSKKSLHQFESQWSFCRMILLLNNLVFFFICRGRRSYVMLRNHKDQLYYAYIHMNTEQNIDYQNVILEYLYKNTRSYCADTTLSIALISISMMMMMMMNSISV